MTPMSQPQNGVAAVLSLVIPGAGQMYKGDVAKGFAWLFGTALGYVLLIIPGLVLHVLCVVNAATAPLPPAVMPSDQVAVLLAQRRAYEALTPDEHRARQRSQILLIVGILVGLLALAALVTWLAPPAINPLRP